MLKRCLLAPLPLFLTLFVFTLPTSAQRQASLRPTVFAIRDARVVTEPGKVLPKATVVVRDGLIEAVGPDVKVPGDALVIDGKGRTVYPGFLDAMSTWGFDAALRRSEIVPAVGDYGSEALAGTKPGKRKRMTAGIAGRTAPQAGGDQASRRPRAWL